MRTWPILVDFVASSVNMSAADVGRIVGRIKESDRRGWRREMNVDDAEIRDRTTGYRSRWRFFRFGNKQCCTVGDTARLLYAIDSAGRKEVAGYVATIARNGVPHREHDAAFAMLQAELARQSDAARSRAGRGTGAGAVDHGGRAVLLTPGQINTIQGGTITITTKKSVVRTLLRMAAAGAVDLPGVPGNKLDATRETATVPAPTTRSAGAGADPAAEPAPQPSPNAPKPLTLRELRPSLMWKQNVAIIEVMLAQHDVLARRCVGATAATVLRDIVEGWWARTGFARPLASPLSPEHTLSKSNRARAEAVRSAEREPLDTALAAPRRRRMTRNESRRGNRQPSWIVPPQIVLSC